MATKEEFLSLFFFLFYFSLFRTLKFLLPQMIVDWNCFWKKKNCQANLKYLMLKKDHLSTDINWLLIYIFLVGLAGICATVFHDGAMNPIEGVSRQCFF